MACREPDAAGACTSMNLLRVAPLLLLCGLAHPCFAQAEGGGEKSAVLSDRLLRYLEEHWKTPEDYVIAKFTDHDVVFLGERHWVRHDVELVQNLIPRLHDAGVYDLGLEFTCYEDQALADSLLTAERYDEDLVRRMFFKAYTAWGYREYMDIYRKAWELNRSLPPEAPKFRIVNLSYPPDWSHLREEMTPALWRKVWHKGANDDHMAEVVQSEILERGKKALVYCGMHHAFTRYRQPETNLDNTKALRFMDDRLGNRIHERLPEGTFTIILHKPWLTRDNKQARPAGGVLDEVMGTFDVKRIGFDVRGTPFGEVRDEETYYSVGYPDFTLESICDGYIYQMPFEEYDGVTVYAGFITEENLKEARVGLGNVGLAKSITTVEGFVQFMNDAADMKRMTKNLR